MSLLKSKFILATIFFVIPSVSWALVKVRDYTSSSDRRPYEIVNIYSMDEVYSKSEVYHRHTIDGAFRTRDHRIQSLIDNTHPRHTIDNAFEYRDRQIQELDGRLNNLTSSTYHRNTVDAAFRARDREIQRIDNRAMAFSETVSAQIEPRILAQVTAAVQSNQDLITAVTNAAVHRVINMIDESVKRGLTELEEIIDDLKLRVEELEGDVEAR